MHAMFSTAGKFRKVEVTESEYRRTADDGAGICTRCGEPADSYVEPDAERYHCAACGEPGVYGLEQLLLRGRVVFV